MIIIIFFYNLIINMTPLSTLCAGENCLCRTSPLSRLINGLLGLNVPICSTGLDWSFVSFHRLK